MGLGLVWWFGGGGGGFGGVVGLDWIGFWRRVRMRMRMSEERGVVKGLVRWRVVCGVV